MRLIYKIKFKPPREMFSIINTNHKKTKWGSFLPLVHEKNYRIGFEIQASGKNECFGTSEEYKQRR